jgi:putative addiction module component (TIGR02574 family)
MTKTAEQMKTQLLGFSLRDRAELARFLIASLDEGQDPDAEPAWDAELSRRLTDIENGLEPGEPAASVFPEMRAKHSA